MPISSRFVSRLKKKNVIYFIVRRYEMPKNAVLSCLSCNASCSIFTCLFYHCTTKNKDIPLKICKLHVGMKLYNIPIFRCFGYVHIYFCFTGIYFSTKRIYYFRGRGGTIEKITPLHAEGGGGCNPRFF